METAYKSISFRFFTTECKLTKSWMTSSSNFTVGERSPAGVYYTLTKTPRDHHRKTLGDKRKVFEDCTNSARWHAAVGIYMRYEMHLTRVYPKPSLLENPVSAKPWLLLKLALEIRKLGQKMTFFIENSVLDQNSVSPKPGFRELFLVITQVWCISYA